MLIFGVEYYIYLMLHMNVTAGAMKEVLKVTTYKPLIMNGTHIFLL